jgi:DNA-binding IclR family transcriptional regulator
VRGDMMGRRIGPAQVRLLSVLLAFKGWAVESSELKRLVGGDRSNARRSLLTLLKRGYVHQWTERGLRYYELGFAGWIFAQPLDADDPAQKASELLRCQKVGIPHA